MYKWHGTYRWKALNEGYNFALNLTLIKGLHTKLCTSKVAEVPMFKISGFPLGSPGTKHHLSDGPMAKRKLYYKGEGGGFPQVKVVVNFVSLCLLVACPCTKSAQTTH